MVVPRSVAAERTALARSLAVVYAKLSEFPWGGPLAPQPLQAALARFWESPDPLIRSHLERARLWRERYMAILAGSQIEGWSIYHFHEVPNHRAVETRFLCKSVEHFHRSRTPPLLTIRDVQGRASWKSKAHDCDGYNVVVPEDRAFVFGCPLVIETYTLVGHMPDSEWPDGGFATILEQIWLQVRRAVTELFCQP